MSNGRNIEQAIAGFYHMRFGFTGVPVNWNIGPKVRITGRPGFDADGNFIGGVE